MNKQIYATALESWGFSYNAEDDCYIRVAYDRSFYEVWRNNECNLIRAFDRDDNLIESHYVPIGVFKSRYNELEAA